MVNKKKISNLITVPWLDSLRPTPGKDNEYFKEKDGFTVRLFASGVISFLFIYNMDGKRKQMALGKYPSTGLALARKAHQDALNIFSTGKDPMAPPEPGPEPKKITTVQMAATDFLENWSKENYSDRWHKNVQWALEADVLPEIGQRNMAEITRQDVIQILERVKRRAPGQARNVSKAMSKLFWHAKKVRGTIDESPCQGLVDVIPELRVSEGKERTLSDIELKKLWHRIDRFPGSAPVKQALKLVLITGQRPEEVAEMHSREFSKAGDEVWWTIPWQRIKTECSKLLKRKRYDHRVFLTPLALSIIGDKKGYIFPSPRTKENEPEQPIRRNSISQRVERPDTIKRGRRKISVQYYGLKKWGPHDLRRTLKTGLAAMDVSDRTADETINHKQSALSKTYNTHTYDQQKSKALTIWSEHLKRVIGLSH